jgi:beta-glucosidase
MKSEIQTMLKKLSLTEKILLCLGADNWQTHGIERLGIPAIKMTDGPHGARVVPSHLEAENKSLPATSFPTASALAATWNPSLVGEVAGAIARETAERGADVILGPGVNIQRIPHCGRNFEYFSEDPFLAAQLGVAYILGVQNEGIGACVKHYAANNQEYERMSISAEIDERTLREIYLPAFEAAVVKASVWMVMCAYNRINGTYASEHKELLTDILRKEWHFDGVVVSDWGAVYNRVPTANAGLDLEMPGPGTAGIKEWQQAIKKRWISRKILDEKVTHILKLISRLDKEQNPRPILPSSASQHHEHAVIARKAAEESIILLKNEGHLLPIQPQKTKNMLVVGPNALQPAIQGSGSAHVTPFSVAAPLEVLRNQVGEQIEIRYAQGCCNTLLVPPMLCEAMLGPSGDKTQGLDAVFFAKPDLTGDVILARKDQIISFHDDDFKIQALQDYNFSARWQGRFVAPISGEYTFGLSSSGLSRLWLDGELVIDNWSDQLPNLNLLEHWISGEKRCKLVFNAGQEVLLLLEYSKNMQPNPVLAMGCRPPMADQLLNEAVTAAREADTVLFFAGYPDGFEAESFDRPSLNLPEETERVLIKVLEANPDTVVVLQNGAPIVMDAWIDKASAIVENGYAGQEGAHALVDILMGKINPSGKLSTTFPKRMEDSPGFLHYPGDQERTLYGEGIFVGYRYFDRKKLEPLFPFGHGLSYTQFTYKNLTCTLTAPNDQPTLELTLTLANTGDRKGKEVVQAYLGAPESTVLRPPKELKAFTKIEIAAGEAVQVQMQIPLADLAYFDVGQKAWVTQSGLYQVYVGSSSRDIRLQDAFKIEDPLIRPVGDEKEGKEKSRLSMESRLMDVLADPQGNKILQNRFGEALDHPQVKLVLRLTLKNIVQMAGNLIPEEAVKGLEEDLRKIK